MKFYSISNANPGYGNDPMFLGFAHKPLPLFASEEISKVQINEYEKHNGPAKWFTCNRCLSELKTPMIHPFSCQSCGHSN